MNKGRFLCVVICHLGGLKMTKQKTETSKENVLFEVLTDLTKTLPHPVDMKILEQKSLQTKGVCQVYYTCTRGEKRTEELSIEFENGAFIIVTALSDRYYLELLQGDTEECYQDQTVEIPM